MIDSAADWLRRAWIAIGWFGIGAVIVLSLIPSPPQLLPVEQGDKVEHMLAFGSLMFWFAQVYLQRSRRLTTAGLLAALGVAIEFAQGDTGYRTFEYADMGADCAGIFVGWVLAPPRLSNLYAWSEQFLLALSRR
jgi:VanZ family protein